MGKRKRESEREIKMRVTNIFIARFGVMLRWSRHDRSSNFNLRLKRRTKLFATTRSFNYNEIELFIVILTVEKHVQWNYV